MEFILGFMLGVIGVFPAYYNVVKQRDQLDDEILELSQKLNEKEI